MEFTDFQSVHAMLKETVDRSFGAAAFRWFTGTGEKNSVTWGQLYDQVKSVAKSLMALGVEPQDKVNIISYSRYAWVLADLGITTAGAATVGIYQSNLPQDCEYIINHSDAVVIFAEDNIQLAKLLEIRPSIPNIRKVILFGGAAPEGDDWVVEFDAFMKLGQAVTDQALALRIDGIHADDPAGIVYTSGTTGVPKGAVLTHDNITFTAQSVKGSGQFQADDEVFLFLPLAHVFARTCLYTAILLGFATTFTRSMETIVDDLKAARPHWFVSVPRIFEKIYTKVISSAEAKGGLALKIFNWAMAVGEQVSDCRLAKKSVPAGLAFKYKMAYKLVFSKINAALGGRVRWCISGAAPLDPTIAKFFHAAGLLILEGIGMTENTSFSNVNRYDNYRFGWVGQPGPGVEQKIGDGGEVMYHGRNVMQGYYKMPEETAATITPEGWLLTGDIGTIDAEDFLKITGRKKDIIITAGGKNIAPAAIEGALATSRYINQVCVIGDKRKYLTALVTVDPDNVIDYAKSNQIAYGSIDELLTHPQITGLIEAQVAEKNKRFASFETVKKVILVPEFTIENGLLTPTLKLKRNIAMERFAKEIDGMYSK